MAETRLTGRSWPPMKRAANARMSGLYLSGLYLSGLYLSGLSERAQVVLGRFFTAEGCDAATGLLDLLAQRFDGRAFLQLRHRLLAVRSKDRIKLLDRRAFFFVERA